MEELTAKQKKCLDFLKSYSAKNGYMPTTLEISSHFGSESTTVANNFLKALKAKGYIERPPRTQRAIRILQQPTPAK
ncbi:MAG: hypothetical protein WBD81_17840 [Collimonas pratensis]|uniref:LexA family protein n=1 Tax=Collimonas pratensis TaxID=279113 RepID=UPI003C72A73A